MESKPVITRAKSTDDSMINKEVLMAFLGLGLRRDLILASIRTNLLYEMYSAQFALMWTVV